MIRIESKTDGDSLGIVEISHTFEEYTFRLFVPSAETILEQLP
jgi:hypothetical protein